MTDGDEQRPRVESAPGGLFCSFCRKSQRDVWKMIARAMTLATALDQPQDPGRGAP